MPELMAIVSERPRPKPRVSLLLSPNRNCRDYPLYQNLLNLPTDEVDKKNISNTLHDRNLVKPKPRRRSLLDPPILEEKRCDENYEYSDRAISAPDRVNEENRDVDRAIQSKGFSKALTCLKTNHEKRKSTVTLSIKNECKSDKNSNCVVKDFNLKPDDFQPIKCMPYNSPRLGKVSRLSNPNMQRTREVKNSALPRAVGNKSPVKTGSVNSDINTKKLQTVSGKNNIPSRSERGAVSTLSQLRKPSFRKLEEVSSSKDSDSSYSSTGSLNSLSDCRRRTGSAGTKDADKRKSAAVPPQMVANLANKFNAMISEHHKVPIATIDIGRKRVNSKGSCLPTIQSCPSSPLRNNLISRVRKDTTKDVKVSKFTPVNFKSTENLCEKQKIQPARSSSPKTLSPKISSPRPSSPKSVSPKSQSPKASSPISVRKKSFVQQAVKNYEVSLSASPSPEIKRRNSLPKRTVTASIDEKTSNVDSFASPVLLRRLLQSAADAKASKFTSEWNHESRLTTNESQINQRIIQQEMPKTGGGRSEGGIATGFSQNAGLGKEGRVLQSQATKECNATTKQNVNSVSAIKTSMISATQIRNSRQEVYSSESKSIDDEISNATISALARGRELFDKRRVGSCNDSGSQSKTVPPPLPATQPRQINNKLSMRRNVSKVVEKKENVTLENKVQSLSNGKKSSYLHANLVDSLCDKAGVDKNNHSNNAKTDEMKSIREISNFKSSFLHSTIGKEVEGKSGENTVENKLVVEKTNYVPNTSFLWREMKTTASGSAIPPPPNSAPPPIPEQNEEQKDCDNIYDDVVSPCSDEFYDEPLYTEANISPQDEKNNGKSRNSFEIITNNDSDEGWVDVSDTEMEGNGHKEMISLPVNSRVKNSNRKTVAKRNSVTRRTSWCQNDSSKVPMNSAPEDYADFDDFSESDESNSTNPDHLYEAVYKLHGEKLETVTKINNVTNTNCILEESPGDGENKDFASRCSLAVETTTVLDKKEKRLKRNWSLTKSDIRLELTSRLNKIRIKKTSTSATDVHSVESCVTENKKTKPWSLKTKFSRKGSDPPSPTKKSPSPRKESALFYVPNCISSNETPDENPRNVISIVAMKGGRRSSNITRPREAPPAPPILSSGKSRAESVCSVESSKRTSISSDFELVQENDNYSRFSGSINSARNVESDTESIRSATEKDCKHRNRTAVSRSSSNVSSESDLPIFLSTSPKIRTSIASSRSSSSNESYHGMEDVEPSLVQQMQLLFQEASQRHNTLRSQASASSGSFATNSDGEEGSYELFRPSAVSKLALLSPFNDEPLYQFYNIDVKKRATQMNLLEDPDTEIYEAIYENEKNPVLKSELTAMELLTPGETGQRSLWGELSEVRNSGILDKITPHQRGLQEAMFEVITSEASYLKSLNVLVNHFMTCQELKDESTSILTKQEWRILFSDVMPVKEVSEKILADLEKRWQENVMMTEICDILLDHASRNFGVYIKYCSNQIYQDRTLKQLKEKNPQFVETLKKLESSPKCQSLAMHSFLMLPMQRITRLPLLVDAIFHRLIEGTKEYDVCQKALKQLNSIVQECNEGARKMARMEEMVVIGQSLNFRDIKNFPLISASRWLVKRGPVQKLTFQESSSKFGINVRRIPKQSLYLFLFTDHLLITKKKGEELFHVLDHCPRNMVQVSEINNLDALPSRPPEGCKYIFKLTMLQNCENKTVDMILSSPSESDRARWMEAVTPKISENPDEKIYESWDCPQVQAIHPYTSQESDEVTLEESDVINVLRKVADGWYYGERIRDGYQGWFPGNYTSEILSAHVRARNLRQRYRLLEGLAEQGCKEKL